MSKNSDIILDPSCHKDGVKQFMDFYALEEEKPDIQFLINILGHYANIPYENISKIIKLNQAFKAENRIRLPEEVIDEHARLGFGGTCFSLTFYLQSILTQHDFMCYPVIAHMRNRPNVHCALVVIMNRLKYLVDPGYLLTQPMEIHPDKPRLYRTTHTGVELRFNKDDESYHLYTFDREEIKWRYTFMDQPLQADEFLKHWQASFYQGTMHGICMTRVQDDGMIYLHNDYLQVTSIEGKIKKKLKENYLDTVQDLFGISPQWVEEALSAIPRNKELEKELGFYSPKKKRSEHETD